ncbi:uncharacterized protein LOC119288342 [Triticum dicoccoides]|uniref:uncharacterized protein LOC119288342 n=1 Tax=Triticum dicoccoides TaxID=85692 RepID=UPI00188FD55B|nr:uncharacterized protein LOC119288342 [Triticum dicoccoides]
MANVNQVADPVALPIVPCPDCGRRVVTFVARTGQFEGERFYKCCNHNPKKGGCDFYRWEEAYAEHLASLGPAAPPLAQINPGENEVGGGGQGGQLQAMNGVAGGQNGAPVLPQVPATIDGEGYVHGAAAVAPRQFTIALDPASINLVVSVGNMAICIAILVLVVASSVMRVFDRD